MSATSNERDITTVQVSKSLHARLDSLKPYESMSFNDLLEDMADEYETNKSGI